ANWLNNYLYFGDFKIDVQSGKFKRLLPTNQDGHVTNLVARDGSIWLFKWQPFGLYRYFPQKDSLQKIDFTGWAPPLGAEVNPTIQMPETGEIWAPTNVSGILVFAEDGKYLRTTNGKNPDDPPLPSVNVKVLYLSDDSTMWIGHDLGFCRLNLKTNTINRYRIRNSNNYEVVGILEDEEQNLWLSTNHGIYLFNVATETFAGFPAYAAIANAEYNRSSFYKASSGKMYFGMLNGVFGFEPEVARDFIAGQKGKRVVLTRISIFNNGTKKFRHLERDLGSIKIIELKHDDGFLNISFAVLDQKSTGNNYFTY